MKKLALLLLGGAVLAALCYGRFREVFENPWVPVLLVVVGVPAIGVFLYRHTVKSPHGRGADKEWW